jgi:hypothetical protein
MDSGRADGRIESGLVTAKPTIPGGFVDSLSEEKYECEAFVQTTRPENTRPVLRYVRRPVLVARLGLADVASQLPQSLVNVNFSQRLDANCPSRDSINVHFI